MPLPAPRRLCLPRLALAAAALLSLAPPIAPAWADEGARPALVLAATASAVRPWMSPDVGAAWSMGFRGQGTTITVIDQFLSGQSFAGNLGTGVSSRRHGDWTRLQAGMVAPGARIVTQDFSKTTAVRLATGLNTLNLSYGMYAQAGLAAGQIGWSPREASIIGFAARSQAVVAKAAGNDGIAVNAANARGQVDYLNTALTGTATAIFVGALSSNGTAQAPASLASYSNFAGTDARVQAQFLSVGVRSDITGLAGTSFAAPVVSGYAAILGSKFRAATPGQIASQLLTTARTDTILNYTAGLHGRGEASLSRALAPVAIR
ncbi:MAG: S8 family serine peptidase [Paracoccaceae bacterium]